jgi:hypothetical protein
MNGFGFTGAAWQPGQTIGIRDKKKETDHGCSRSRETVPNSRPLVLTYAAAREGVRVYKGPQGNQFRSYNN